MLNKQLWKRREFSNPKKGLMAMNRGLNDENDANELRLMKLIQMLICRSDDQNEKKFPTYPD